MGLSFWLSLALAFPIGVAAATRPQGRLDAAVNLFCFAGISVPPFWLALLLIGFFSVDLGWLPPSGSENVGDGSLPDRALHLAMFLPVLGSVKVLAHCGIHSLSLKCMRDRTRW